MASTLPPEIWIRIALATGQDTDEHTFNSLVRAISGLGRWTIGARDGTYHDSVIIGWRLDLMLMFGYSVMFRSRVGDVYGWGIETGLRYDCIVWKKNGRIHRNDGPAVVSATGDFHDCNEGSAVRYSWQYQDQSHRVGGPSDESLSSWQVWYQYGEMWRHDGPAYMNGMCTVEWCQGEDDLHRTDGPTDIRSNGDIKWFVYSDLHRIDGPAVIYGDGECEFYQYGEEMPR